MPRRVQGEVIAVQGNRSIPKAISETLREADLGCLPTQPMHRVAMVGNAALPIAGQTCLGFGETYDLDEAKRGVSA